MLNAEYPQYASPIAHETLQQFSAETLMLDPETLRRRAERVNKTLRLFAGDQLPQRAYDAAALLPLTRLIQGDEHPERSATAALHLMDYLTNPDETHGVDTDDADYMLAVWDDFETIDEASLDYEERIRERNSALGNEVLKVIDRQDGMEFSEHHWTSVKVGVNVQKISEVTKKVNVESVVIGAADILDKIIYEKDPIKQMHHILVAETFYCPTLDAFGLSPMEAAIRDEINGVRLRNAGKEHLVVSAKEALRPIKEVGQDRVIEELFGKLPDNEGTLYHIDNMTPYGSTIHFRKDSLRSLFDENDQEPNVTGTLLTRTKTDRSTALKLGENKDYEGVSLPNDIIGMTAIVEDEAQIVDLFQMLHDRVQSLENFRFVTAPSKETPVCVQGSVEYLKTIKSLMSQKENGQSMLDHTQFKADKDGRPSGKAFQVTKVTAMATIDGVDVPIEIQVQTEEDWTVGRLGAASHLAYKGNGNSKSDAGELPTNIAGEESDLRDIYERMLALVLIDNKKVIYDKSGAQNLARKMDQVIAKNS